ncbi:hypothetical protein U9Y97_22580, partial [Escherichia coli]
MKQKELWINQIKGLCICLVVIYHSVITFYPHLTTFQHPLSEVLSKCWIYFIHNRHNHHCFPVGWTHSFINTPHAIAELQIHALDGKQSGTGY